MTRIGIILICFITALLSCDKEGEDELEGKWQLRTVEENGVTVEVDTVWYNFQTSLFQYQLYDANVNNGVYYYNYGYKTLTDDTLRLSLIYTQFALEEFLALTDWHSAQRTFVVEEHSGNKLVLTSEGKTYTFRKF